MLRVLIPIEIGDPPAGSPISIGISDVYLEVRKEKITPGQDPRVQKAIAIQDTLVHQDTLPEWDSTAEIRRWREGNY